jgi:hypothetical protein
MISTSLTHSEGWNCMWPSLIQRRAPSTLTPKSLTATSETRQNAIGPGHEVDELVVVDPGEDEHGHQAARDPVDLLGVVAGVLGVQGGRVDFEHRDGAEQQHQAQQGPVKVAKAEHAAHGYRPFPSPAPVLAMAGCGSGTMVAAELYLALKGHCFLACRRKAFL